MLMEASYAASRSSAYSSMSLCNDLIEVMLLSARPNARKSDWTFLASLFLPSLLSISSGTFLR